MSHISNTFFILIYDASNLGSKVVLEALCICVEFIMDGSMIIQPLSIVFLYCFLYKPLFPVFDHMKQSNKGELNFVQYAEEAFCLHTIINNRDIIYRNQLARLK